MLCVCLLCVPEAQEPGCLLEPPGRRGAPQPPVPGLASPGPCGRPVLFHPLTALWTHGPVQVREHTWRLEAERGEAGGAQRRVPELMPGEVAGVSPAPAAPAQGWVRPASLAAREFLHLVQRHHPHGQALKT